MVKFLINCIVIFLIAFLFLTLIKDSGENKICIILSLVITGIYIYYMLYYKNKKENMENASIVETNNNSTSTVETNNNSTSTVETNKLNKNVDYYKEKNKESKNSKKLRDENITNTKASNINTRNQFNISLEEEKINSNEQIEGVKDETIVTDENKYDDFGGYIDAHSIYVPRDYKYTNDDYGYNFIPPLNWLELPDRRAPRLPLCVSTDGKCKVSPSITSGYPMNMKEWNASRKILGPDAIDIQYIQDHMNTTKTPDQHEL